MIRNWVNYNNLVAHVVKEIDKEKNEVLRKKKEGIEALKKTLKENEGTQKIYKLNNFNLKDKIKPCFYEVDLIFSLSQGI